MRAELLSRSRRTGRASRRCACAVLGQMRALAEGLVTRVARVGPLARVRPPVLAEVGAAAEGLATLSAGVSLLTGVHPPVLAQVGEPAEGLATLHACVGLGPLCITRCCARCALRPKAFPHSLQV